VKQEEQRLRAEREQIRNDRAALETARTEQAAIVNEIKQDPMAFLEKNGIDFRELATNHVQTDETSQQIMKMAAKTESLEAELASVKAQQEATGADRVRAMERAGFNQTIQGDQFALLRTHPGAVDEMEKLVTHYKEVYRTPLTNEKAADMLQNQYREMLKAAAAHEAVQKELGITAPQAPAAPGTPPEPASPPVAKAPPTSVSGTQTLPSPPGQSTKLTREELAKRVAAKLPPNFISTVL
jgi:hypothetical protein